MVNDTHTRRRRSIVYHCHGAQRYEQFLQGQLIDRALTLLHLALYLLSASVSSVSMVLYIFNFFVVTFCTLLLSELNLVGLSLDLVDQPLSSSAVTLLVGSSDLKYNNNKYVNKYLRTCKYP